jgi:hypothetical protein
MRIYFLILLLAVFSLSGCQQKPPNYEEMMTHPDLLANAMASCRVINFKGENCDQVQRAQSDFSGLIATRGSNPQAFGWIVLNAETNLAVFEKLYHDKKTLPTKRAYDAQLLKVNVLLAVLNATSTDF